MAEDWLRFLRPPSYESTRLNLSPQMIDDFRETVDKEYAPAVRAIHSA